MKLRLGIFSHILCVDVNSLGYCDSFSRACRLWCTIIAVRCMNKNSQVSTQLPLQQ